MKQTVNIEQCLKDIGFAVVPISGTSMWPLLKEGKSQIQLVSGGTKQLKKGDVVLYRREDGTLVLHRIIKIVKRNTYLVCGDHQWKLEEQIREDQILAAAQGFFMNGRYIDEKTWWYQLYKKFWTGNLMMRRCCLAFLRLTGLEKKSLK